MAGDYSAVLNVGINETVEFFVEFSPSIAAKLAANIQITVEDNPFEDNIIELIGEGYCQEFTIENINQLTDWQAQQKHDSQHDTEAIVGKLNCIVKY